MVYWLTGFMGGLPVDRQSHDAGQVAVHRDGELQLLTLHQIPVRHALAAAGNDAVFDGKLVLRNAEPLRRQIEQGLIGIGRRFADVRRARGRENRKRRCRPACDRCRPSPPW